MPQVQIDQSQSYNDVPPPHNLYPLSNMNPRPSQEEEYHASTLDQIIKDKEYEFNNDNSYPIMA